jgi:hypothetical protein
MGTQLMPMRDAPASGRGEHDDTLCVDRKSLTLVGRAAVDGVHVARHAAEHGNGRAARADGDVQAAEHNAEQAPEEALGGGVEVVRVLDVLAALLRRRRRAARAGASGDGGDGADDGESGDEDLGEHDYSRSREGRGSGKGWLWEFESEERVEERPEYLYPSSASVRHMIFGACMQSCMAL